MDERFRRPEERVSRVEARNARVEANKAWETSGARMLLLLLLTYVFASAALYAIGAEHVWRSALIPTLGYAVSTFSLSFVRRRWNARRR